MGRNVVLAWVQKPDLKRLDWLAAAGNWPAQAVVGLPGVEEEARSAGDCPPLQNLPDLHPHLVTRQQPVRIPLGHESALAFPTSFWKPFLHILWEDSRPGGIRNKRRENSL